MTLTLKGAPKIKSIFLLAFLWILFSNHRFCPPKGELRTWLVIRISTSLSGYIHIFSDYIHIFWLLYPHLSVCKFNSQSQCFYDKSGFWLANSLKFEGKCLWKGSITVKCLLLSLQLHICLWPCDRKEKSLVSYIAVALSVWLLTKDLSVGLSLWYLNLFRRVWAHPCLFH